MFTTIDGVLCRQKFADPVLIWVRLNIVGQNESEIVTEGRKYPREYLVAEIKRVARIVGDMPTMEQFEQNSEIAAVTLAKRFKGWRNALASAGFDSTAARTEFDDQELREELKRVATLLGHTPTTTEFAANSDYSSSTVTRRLGDTWADACLAVGLIPPVTKKPALPNPGWNKGTRKLKISRDELSYLYETEGLSAAAIATRLGASSQSVLRALREYGFKIKRLHYSMPKETSIETLLYQEMEKRNVPFARQQVVDGRYLVDALIMGAKIVIECDGDYWHALPGRPEKDERRQKYLQSRGYIVLRFSEAVLKTDIEACVQKVVEALFERIKK